jgi:hypothetical protein
MEELPTHVFAVSPLLDGPWREIATGYLSPDRGHSGSSQACRTEAGLIQYTSRAPVGKTRLHVECVALLGA